jgi:hypothetical protein
MAVIAVISIILVVISLALSIYQMLQRPPEPPTPSPRELAGVPSAEQGMDVPVLFGTRWIYKSNVVWWGNPRSVPIVVNSNEIP